MDPPKQRLTVKDIADYVKSMESPYNDLKKELKKVGVELPEKTKGGSEINPSGVLYFFERSPFTKDAKIEGIMVGLHLRDCKNALDEAEEKAKEKKIDIEKFKKMRTLYKNLGRMLGNFYEQALEVRVSLDEADQPVVNRILDKVSKNPLFDYPEMKRAGLFPKDVRVEEGNPQEFLRKKFTDPIRDDILDAKSYVERRIVELENASKVLQGTIKSYDKNKGEGIKKARASYEEQLNNVNQIKNAYLALKKDIQKLKA
jgi:hypothetical protein